MECERAEFAGCFNQTPHDVTVLAFTAAVADHAWLSSKGVLKGISELHVEDLAFKFKSSPQEAGMLSELERVVVADTNIFEVFDGVFIAIHRKKGPAPHVVRMADARV